MKGLTLFTFILLSNICFSQSTQQYLKKYGLKQPVVKEVKDDSNQSQTPQEKINSQAYELYKKAIELNDDEAILELYNKIIALYPNDYLSTYYNNRGATKLRLKDYLGSIEDFTNSINITPNQYAYSERGTAYYYLKEYESAINDKKKSYEISKEPKSTFDLNWLSTIYLELGQINEASYYINKYISNSNPTDIKPRHLIKRLKINKSRLRVDEGNSKEIIAQSLKDIDNILKEVDNFSEVYYSAMWDKAQFLSDLGNYDEAISIYKDLKSSNKEKFNTSAYYNNLSYYYEQKEDYYSAISNLIAAIKVLENDEYEFKLKFQFRLAQLKLKIGDEKGYLNGLEEILLADPEFKEAKLHKILYLSGKKIEALGNDEVSILKIKEETALNLLKLYPKEPSLYFDLLQFKFKTSDFEGGQEYLDNFLDLKNEDDMTVLELNQVAVFFREKGDLYQAIYYYTKGLELNPNYVTLIGGFGTTKFKLGDVDSACKLWSEAIGKDGISDDSFKHYSKLMEENCK